MSLRSPFTLCFALSLLLSACNPGVDLGYTDNSIHGGHYADPLAHKYRTNTLDPHVVRVPKQIAGNVSRDPATYLQPLVDYLIKGAGDDYIRVKRIHDWIAHNIAYDSVAYHKGTIPSQTVVSVLTSRKAVCEGFADLFGTMAFMAGLEGSAVNGYSKGGQFMTDGRLSAHAWNVVKVGARWYLLDVTRDAGVTSGVTFKRRYSTRYLFLAPVAFVHVNLPLDPGYQLLANPLSLMDFQELPYLNGYFFQYRLRLTSKPVASTIKVVNYLILDVETPAGVYLMSSVKGGTKDVAHAAFSQRWGTKYRVLYQPPKAGNYRVQIHARTTKESTYHMVAAFQINKTKDSPTPKPFPVAYTPFVDSNGYLTSPMDGELRRYISRYFRVAVPGASQVYLYGSNTQKLATLKAGKGSEFTGFFKVPSGVSEINVAALFKGAKSLSLLLKYKVK